MSRLVPTRWPESSLSRRPLPRPRRPRAPRRCGRRPPLRFPLPLPAGAAAGGVTRPGAEAGEQRWGLGSDDRATDAREGQMGSVRPWAVACGAEPSVGGPRPSVALVLPLEARVKRQGTLPPTAAENAGPDGREARCRYELIHNHDSTSNRTRNGIFVPDPLRF